MKIKELYPDAITEDLEYEYKVELNPDNLIKWAKTRKASFFLLSNKEVQVIFNDNTQVIFNMKNLTVLYINHLKQKINEDMRLNTFSSFEMTIRVLYAKEVLTRL